MIEPAAPMAASPLRWPLAATLALLLHLPLLWTAAGSLSPSQDSAGIARGAGEAPVSALELRFAAAADSAETGSGQRSAPVPAQDAGGGGRDSYYARLRAHLQRHRRTLLTQSDVKGAAVVGFRVGGDGRVSALKLERSAGNALLDAEALDLVRRSTPLPPPPQGRSLRLSVPIAFD